MIQRQWGFRAAVIVGLSAMACVSLEPVPDGADGLWKARRPGGGDQVRLDVYRGPVGHRDTERVRLYFDLGEIQGLDAEAFGKGTSPLGFEIDRPAGKLVFEGTRARRPGGSFSLEPSPEFIAGLDRLEVRHGDREHLLDLAIYDVSLELVESLLSAGYAGGDAEDILRLHHYGLTAEWITAMARLEGPPSVHDLLSLRNHGIQARHIDRWFAAGIHDLPVDDLIRLNMHGFPASDGATYRELGFNGIDEWLSFHRNGIPKSLIAAVVESEASDRDVDAIVRLYVHGIPADGVRAAAPLIEAGFDWDALVSLSRHGITPDYAIALIDSGWDGLDAQQVVRMAVNGLETEWILRVRAASEESFEEDDLIELRHYGVAASEYERYAALGYVEIDDVRVLVTHGVQPAWLDGVAEFFKEPLSSDDVVILSNAGVDASHLRQLADAGFVDPYPEDVAAARHRGLERWIEENRR